MPPSDEVYRTIKDLRDGNLEERREAAEKLSQFGDRGTIPILLDQLKNETNPQTRIYIIQSLAGIGDISSTTKIEKIAFEDENNDVKSAAIEALANFRQTSSTFILNQIVMNSAFSPRIREEASRAIGIIEGYA